MSYLGGVMNTITVRYMGEIYIINRNNINYVNIKSDSIIKNDNVLLIVVLNNGNIVLRCSTMNFALFLANKIVNEDENEITI